jgi:3',5'-nucleoside bisphosphate phosphatase
MKADLHIHTIASDGCYSASDIVQKAKKLNIDMIAVADHDSIGAVSSAMQISKKQGVTCVPAIEFSAKYHKDIHILGYLIDVESDALVNKLKGLEADRLTRVHRFIEVLNDRGIVISFDDVVKNADSEILGRVHIAKALIEKGYVKNVDQAFDKYLADEDMFGVKREKISAQACIELINLAGGISVLAHPCYMYDEKFEFYINELASFGLNGIEAYHPDHTDDEVVVFEKYAMDKGLLVTSGSDFHGSAKPEVDIGCEKRTSDYLEFCKDIIYRKAKENFF